MAEPRGLPRLVAVVDRLRRECPWTQDQTHDSLRRYLLEEAYEVLEALDSGDAQHLREELGDLLFQIVFHARIATEHAGWDVDDVADDIADKLIRRSPHVFADGGAATAAEVDAAWQAIKATEKPRERPDEGIPAALPALAYAQKMLDRVPDLDTSGDDLGHRLLRLVAEARDAGLDAEAELRRALPRRSDSTH